MRLRNTNPLGAVDLPLVGKTLAAGEEFDVDNDEQALALLDQAGNFEAVDPEQLKLALEEHRPQPEPQNEGSDA